MTAIARENTLGVFLRTLRKARRLSMEQAAKTAGVHWVTLSRWERGEAQPRLPELESALCALSADAMQKRRALTLMDAPRARAQMRVEIIRAGERTGIGPMPHGGDLLRAIRHRRGLSLEETAARLGITTRTLRFWENAETWPSLTQLHALCQLLDAHEEEIVAITCGRFTRTPSAETLSLETLHERLERVLGYHFMTPAYPLTELEFLTLEAQVWPLAMRETSGRRLLANVYARHADHLSGLGNFAEAGRMSERALALLPEGTPAEPFWLYAVLASARAAVFRGEKPAPRRGLERLRAWLPLARWPEFEAWILADMAKYEALRGETEASLGLAEQARQTAARFCAPVEKNLREMDEARMLIRAQRPADALPLLPPSERLGGINRVDAGLLKAEAYLGLGSLSEAHDWLLRAYADIETFDLPHLRPRAEALAAKF